MAPGARHQPARHGRVARAALPWLRQAAAEKGQAAIVNTSSIAATAGLPQRALYSATKGAVYSLTLAMAADHAREHIRVTCVTPRYGRHSVDRRAAGSLLDGQLSEGGRAAVFGGNAAAAYRLYHNL
jgi:NAD(P)-dependent dehydrogenase (short-subunit alcohol dehydrogenase family)